MRRAVAFGVLAASLGGCAGSDNFFTAPKGGGSAFGNLLAFNTTDPGPLPTPASREAPLQCPQIEVMDGTSAVRTYSGADQSNGTVRYQFSLGDVARECTKVGNQILIKVGVSGRVLLGPSGQPGSFTAPVRIAIRRDADQKPAAAKLYQVSATVPFGQTQGDFTVVSEPIAVPFVQANADQDYTVLVGFDEHAPAVPGSAPGRRTKATRG